MSGADITWEEAVANRGRFAWRLDHNGERSGELLQWGQPDLATIHGRVRPTIMWSNGFTEMSIRMEGLKLEWYSESE